MQDFLDLQLAGRLEVGALAADARENLALFVGEEAHGLRASRVDTDDVLHSERVAAVDGQPRGGLLARPARRARRAEQPGAIGHSMAAANRKSMEVGVAGSRVRGSRVRDRRPVREGRSALTGRDGARYSPKRPHASNRPRMVLTWIDYTVIAAYLLAITAFGTWFSRFQKTTVDYFLTGRSVPWWAICFTIVATETSTLSFIGVPAGAYSGNMTFLQLAFGYVIGRILVSVLFLPSYFRGELFTSYELLQRRFGAEVKKRRRGDSS
jgi:hypothetical protein